MAGFGVVVLTTIFSGITAYYLALFLIWVEKMPAFEGQQGLFLLAFVPAGVGAGLVIGLITVVAMQTDDFSARLLRATEIVAALALVIAVTDFLAEKFKDQGPKLEGSPLVLEVELKCWPGWKPTNAVKAGHGACYVKKNADSTWSSEMGRDELTRATFLWKDGLRDDGSWVVTCGAELSNTTSPRYLLVFVGNGETSIEIPLPRHPKAAALNWSQWSSSGFSAAKPHSNGLAFRYRVVKSSDWDASREASPDEEALRKNKMAAMPPDAPLSDWLPVFAAFRTRAAERDELSDAAKDAVRSHPEQLAPLLASPDLETAQRAVYAATVLEEVPSSLLKPLAASGHWIVELLEQARAQSTPGDPDEITERKARNFFEAWQKVMKLTGDAGAPQRRAVIEHVAAELDRGSKDTVLQVFADMVKSAQEH